MTIFTILIFYAALYFVAFIVFGSLYSSRMQEVNRLGKLMQTGKFEKEYLLKKIAAYQDSIRKWKRIGWGVFLILFLFNLLMNVLTLNEQIFYIYAAISCVACLLLLLVVYWLRGSGTIDDNARFSSNGL